MNPFRIIIQWLERPQTRRRRELIELECRVAGLKAKLRRTELLASRMKDNCQDVEAIKITEELWVAKRKLQLLNEDVR